MRGQLYQKCLRCPWLWGCGLWWCSQWWCWLWGCSTETPADPLGSPTQTTHSSANAYFKTLVLQHLFCTLWICCFLKLAAHPPSVDLSASPCSPISALPQEHGSSQQWHQPLHSVPSPISPSFFSFSLQNWLHTQPWLLSCRTWSCSWVLVNRWVPSYSRCHRCMASAPSRTSACWPGRVCWGGWTPLLWGHSCWSGRNQGPVGIRSSGPPSRTGNLKKQKTWQSWEPKRWSRGQKCVLLDTFEEEGLIPVRVKILPFDFGLQFVLLVWQQVELDKRIRGAGEVLGGQVLALEDLDRESGILKTVAHAELNATKLLTHWALVLIFLWAWR